MLIGVFFGGLFMSIFVTKTFHISYIPTLWKERKNKSIKSRMIWSFIAGFLLIFGARLAGGCNAGHILSGGSQLAISGIVFAIVALGTGVITGRFFYKKRFVKMIESLQKMFAIVANEGHGSVWTVLLIGFLFGAIILYSRLDKFEKMAGFMIFEDTLVPRMAMTTVALFI